MIHILQISSGQGPAECRRFVPLLADIICGEAARTHITCRPLAEYSGKDDQLASLCFVIDGAELESFRTTWEGTVKWVWKSEIRPNWPRKNWFVKVSFFDFTEETGSAFRPEELKMETFRASGPGGQHVNRTDSAVRVTHLPSGIVCTASEERSQIRNRELALLRLREKLNLIGEQQHAAQNEVMRLEHYQLERGRPVRVFCGMPPRETK